MAPPRVDEWTYVGEGIADVNDILQDCELRVSRDVYDDAAVHLPGDKTEFAGMLVLLPMVLNIKAEKYFAQCMNGRGFSREADVERLRKEIQENTAAAEKRRNDRKAAIPRIMVMIDDHVAARFQNLVVYMGS